MESLDEKKKEIEAYTMSASPDELDEFLFVLRFIANASPDEMDDLREKMKREDFDAKRWIALQREIRGVTH